MEQGYHPVLAPLLQIEPLAAAIDWPDPGVLQALVVTSSNALAAVPPALHKLPLLAVGNATAAKAGQTGFSMVESANGAASTLAELVRNRLDFAGLPLLLTSGRGQGKALADDLRQAGFSIQHREVYAAHPVTALPVAVIQALQDGNLAAALFFSAETARVFGDLLPPAVHPALMDVEALAMSAAVAAALPPLPWRRIRVAVRPTQHDMLALL
jgi:uroporphyrinogen-III synthase